MEIWCWRFNVENFGGLVNEGYALHLREVVCTEWGTAMAAATIATVPKLAAYLPIRGRILAVILEGAVKG